MSNNISNINIVNLIQNQVQNENTQQQVTINYNQPYSYGNYLRVTKQINKFNFTDITFETNDDLSYYKKIVSPINISSTNYTGSPNYLDAYFSVYKNRQIFGLESNEAYVVDDYGTKVLEIIKINDEFFTLERLFLSYEFTTGESFYVSRIDSTKKYSTVEGEFVVIVAGSPPGIPGSTNAMRVHRVGDAVGGVAPAYR
jgi:hypothetical protein